GHALLDHFWDCPDAQCRDGCSTEHGFDHDETERLRGLEGVDERPCSAEQLCFRLAIDRSDVPNETPINQGLDLLLIVLRLRPGDQEWDAGSLRHLDGEVQPFVRCQSSEKTEIVLRLLLMGQARYVKTVVYRRQQGNVRVARPLRSGDRRDAPPW